MAFIKCQYTDDYLLTFLLPTSGLSLLICLVLFPGSFLCKLPAVSHVFFLWDIPACFLPYSISFSSSYLPLFFRIISSMLYLGKRVYASFIDLLALLYPFQLYFIGSDPGIYSVNYYFYCFFSARLKILQLIHYYRMPSYLFCQ